MKTIKIILVMSLFSVFAHAEDSRESYAGALGGVAVETSAEGSHILTYSARAGTSLLIDQSGILSLGLFIGRGSDTESMGTLTAKGTYTVIATEIITRKVLGSGLYIGGRFGLALNYVEITGNGGALSTSASSFFVGPAAGYEFPVMQNLDLNLDVSWATIGGTTFTFPGITSIQTSAISAFYFQGGVSYRW